MRIILLTLMLLASSVGYMNAQSSDWFTKGMDAQEKAESDPNFKKQHLLEADEFYKSESEINNQYYELFNNWGNVLADLYEVTGERSYLTASVDKYQRAAALNSNYAPIYFNWGYTLFDYGSKNNDIEYLKNSVDKFDKTLNIDAQLEQARDYKNQATTLIAGLEEKKEKELAAQAPAPEPTPEPVQEVAVVDERPTPEPEPEPTPVIEAPKYGDREEFRSTIEDIEAIKAKGLNNNSLQEIIDYCQRAARANNKNIVAYEEWSKALLMQGVMQNDVTKVEGSIDRIQLANELEPNNPSHYINTALAVEELARMTEDVGLFPACEVLYRKAISMEALPEFYENFATMYRNWGALTKDKAISAKAKDMEAKAKAASYF